MSGELANLIERYRKSVQMADMLGMPRPAPPEALQQQRQRRQQARAQRQQVPRSAAAEQNAASVDQRLFSKLQFSGFNVKSPEGYLNYSLLPGSLRQDPKHKEALGAIAPQDTPIPAGWDPNTLEPDELARARMWIAKGQAERPRTEASEAEIRKAQRIIDAGIRERRKAQTLAKLKQLESMGK